MHSVVSNVSVVVDDVSFHFFDACCYDCVRAVGSCGWYPLICYQKLRDPGRVQIRLAGIFVEVTMNPQPKVVNYLVYSVARCGRVAGGDCLEYVIPPRGDLLRKARAAQWSLFMARG